MENLAIITDANHLNKIFENAADKLVVLMFYTKNNPDCRRAKTAFEKSAQNHMITNFCIIDMDKFEGDSRYVKNINNMPRFDFYYQGNPIGSYPGATDKEIEDGIRSGERYVMVQNNMKNNQNNQNNNMAGMMGMNQMQQMNLTQIKTQILNNAMMQNPMLASQLMQNPMMLEQMAQKQIQQQMMQQQMMPQMTQVPMMNMPTLPNMPNTMMQNLPNVNTQIPATNIASPSISNNVLPTFEQMQYYLKIFQMMQQMGILNTNTLNNLPAPDISPKQPQTESDNTIILPNGDKLVPLPNGKYGLIKKSS